MCETTARMWNRASDPCRSWLAAAADGAGHGFSLLSISVAWSPRRRRGAGTCGVSGNPYCRHGNIGMPLEAPQDDGPAGRIGIDDPVAVLAVESQHLAAVQAEGERIAGTAIGAVPFPVDLKCARTHVDEHGPGVGAGGVTVPGGGCGAAGAEAEIGFHGGIDAPPDRNQPGPEPVGGEPGMPRPGRSDRRLDLEPGTSAPGCVAGHVQREMRRDMCRCGRGRCPGRWAVGGGCRSLPLSL